ncbi:hypothetical protein JCM19302_3595 [Jejuia pallidilutea]|uniref:Uncharacterized protein n=1 Tax=Jejuia pallidilutea TaxID=504487 RepID=A0A090W2T0_9FLAO|nr:hypothetical protein JCM19302_3595 [Jejuia pallidilutea]
MFYHYELLYFVYKIQYYNKTYPKTKKHPNLLVKKKGKLSIGYLPKLRW